MPKESQTLATISTVLRGLIFPKKVWGINVYLYDDLQNRKRVIDEYALSDDPDPDEGYTPEITRVLANHLGGAWTIMRGGQLAAGNELWWYTAADEDGRGVTVLMRGLKTY